jgi:hypothetical protein
VRKVSGGRDCDEGRRRGEKSTYLRPRHRLDLRKRMLDVARIHLHNLVLRRRAQNLDDLDKLVDSARSGEEDAPGEKLAEDATGGPEIDRVCEKRKR